MRGQKAFTLIELLSSMVLLGVLAAVAIPVYVDLQAAAEQAQVKSVGAALGRGMQSVRTSWIIQGAQGDGSNARVDIDVGGVPVRFRNGLPVNVNSSAHVPAGTPNRDTASSKLFHLFLSSTPEVVSRDSNDTGWTMLANRSCVLVTRPRCWEYRRGGQRIARVTYSGQTGEFFID